MPNRSAWLTLALLASACSSSSGADGGVVTIDGGVAFIDGGVVEGPAGDGGVSFIDGGVSFIDGGTGGGVNFIDGGVITIDGGVVEVVNDGGVRFIDGGVVTIDGGVVVADGGSADASAPLPDGGGAVADGGSADAFTPPPPAPSSPLRAHWRFDQTMGTAALDSSGNGYDAQLVNLNNSDWVPGRIGNALDFNGADNYLHSTARVPATYTVSMWIDPNGIAGSRGGIATTSATAAYSAFTLYWDTSQAQIRAQLYNTNGSLFTGNIGNLSLGGWFHVALVADVMEARLYVNGEQRALAQLSRPPVTAPGTLEIGRTREGNSIYYWGGRIDDVRLYDRPLTPAEVSFVAAGLERARSLLQGTFPMGSAAGEVGRGTDEILHMVTLTQRFQIMVGEVTQEMFMPLMGYQPSQTASCPTCPVENVSWHEAAAFANAVSSRAGLATCYACSGIAPNVTCTPPTEPHRCGGYRLPTEAEWEYAARAGATGAFDDDGQLPAGTATECGTDVATTSGTPLAAFAWYCRNATGPRPSGRLLEGPTGLFDMRGNAGEWVHDLYQANLGAGAVTNPTGAGSGGERVVKGGDWSSPPAGLRAASRSRSASDQRSTRIGFRLVRSG